MTLVEQRRHGAQGVELGPLRGCAGLAGRAQAVHLGPSGAPPHAAHVSGRAAEVHTRRGRLELQAELVAGRGAPRPVRALDLRRLVEGAGAIPVEQHRHARAQAPVDAALAIEERERYGGLGHRVRRRVWLSTSVAVPSTS